MKSITLHTAHRRIRKDGPVFADAGETLAVGDEISVEDAAVLIAHGGAVSTDSQGREAVVKPKRPHA